jgi:PAS domain S-box-containing protein
MSTMPLPSDTILETLSEAVLVVTNDNHIVRINAAAAALYGVDAHDVVGWSLPMLIGEITEETVALGLDTVLHGQVWRGVVWHRKPSGGRFRAAVSVHYLRDQDVFVALVEDATERERAAQRREVLARALSQIAESTDFRSAVKTVLELLVGVSGAQGGVYRRKGTQGYSLMDSVLLERNDLDEHVEYSREEPALECGEVVTVHAPAEVRHGDQAPGFVLHLVGQRVAGRLVGTVALFYRAAPQLDLREVLAEIANALGANLEREQQWQAVVQRNRLLEVLGRIDRLSLDVISVQSLVLSIMPNVEEIFGAVQVRIGHIPASESSVTWLADSRAEGIYPVVMTTPSDALLAVARSGGGRGVHSNHGEEGKLSVGVINSEGTLIFELSGARRLFTEEDESGARFIAAQLALVVSRVQDRDRLLRERTRLEVLAGVSLALREARTQSDLARTAAEHALRATRASTAMVLLASAARDTFSFAAVSGINAEQVLDSKVVTRERGLSWRVLDSGRPRIEDIALSLPEAHTVRKLAQGAYIGIPIFEGEGAARRTIGVLTADTQADGERFTITDLDCLTAIAESYSSARARLEALETAERRAHAYARLAQLGSDLELLDEELQIAERGLHGLLDLTGLEAAAYFTLHGAFLRARATLGPLPAGFLTQREATPLEPGRGVFGVALETAQVQLIENYGTDPRSQGAFAQYGFFNSLVAPITLDGVVRGFIAATGYRADVVLEPNTLEVAEFIARRVSRALERAEQRTEILSTRASSFRALGLALEVRDFETKGHTDRVTCLCVQLGRAVGLSVTQLQHLEWGALLHDIGKIAVPDSILLKPGKLTPSEWELIREHPETGYRMLEGLHFLPLETLEIVRYHQERLDGSGYPESRAGDDIPYLARLFAVVDVFDALTSERPYKRAWSEAQAFAELRAQAGVTLEASLVDALIAMLEGVSA